MSPGIEASSTGGICLRSLQSVCLPLQDCSQVGKVAQLLLGVHCTVGWVDLALFSNFLKIHVVCGSPFRNGFGK